MENVPSWHGVAPNDEEYKTAMEELEGDWKHERKSLREAFGDEMLVLGRENKDIYIVDADVGKSCKTLAFASAYPDQHVNVGIAGAECLWNGGRTCCHRQDTIYQYICSFWFHEYGGTDQTGNLLSKAKCKDRLFSWGTYTGQ